MFGDDVTACKLTDDCIRKLEMVARFVVEILFVRKESSNSTWSSDEHIPPSSEEDYDGTFFLDRRANVAIVHLVLRK